MANAWHLDDEFRQAGVAAYEAGMPYAAPQYRREAERARWRLGWKYAAAKAGDQEAFDHTVMVDEQRRILAGQG